MKRYSLTHLSNEVLRRELSNTAAGERGATAELIAHIAEFDARRLYLPAAYGSMLTYCVGELGRSEDEAKKRIRVARAARRCPAVFEALATGQVHLSGLVLLSARLTPETADELLAAAAHKTRDEIERELAARFPIAEMTASVEAVTSRSQSLAVAEGAPGPLRAPELTVPSLVEGSPGNPRARVAPLSVEAFAVQFTRSREADERFRYLQDLLGHQVARADIAEVHDRAVKELIAKMERVRFGACARPRSRPGRTKPGSRHIPAHVKREEAKAAAARRKVKREQQAEESRLLPHEQEVMPWLRQLGCREDEARLAARRCWDMADAPLEDRVKRALSWFGARIGRKVSPVPATSTSHAEAGGGCASRADRGSISTTV